MIKLTSRWANTLLDYANEHGIHEIYRQTLTYILNGGGDPAQAPEELRKFIALIPGGKDEVSMALYAFLDLAREQMNVLPVEIISAVPLTPEQLIALERRLIKMFKKQLDITTTVDPSILGGIRVISNNTMLDDTIKRKLLDMKNSIYERVYFRP